MIPVWGGGGRQSPVRKLPKNAFWLLKIQKEKKKLQLGWASISLILRGGKVGEGGSKGEELKHTAIKKKGNSGTWGEGPKPSREPEGGSNGGTGCYNRPKLCRGPRPPIGKRGEKKKGLMKGQKKGRQ